MAGCQAGADVHNAAMERQLAVALYFGLAVAAAIVTGSGALHGVSLFIAVIVVGLVASIYRRQVLGAENFSRQTALWLVVYAVALVVASLTLRSRPV